MKKSSEKYELRIASKARKQIRKLPSKIRKAIDQELDIIISNPEIGELKYGDLAGIRVHKFKPPSDTEQILIGYEIYGKVIAILAIGHHERYYDRLKIYLRTRP